MNVVAMLEVPVAVVDMVDVVPVLDGLAPVVLGVRGTVVWMDLGLGVPFAVVQMVDVVAVHDGLVTVAGQVLVVARFHVFGGCHPSSPSSGPPPRQRSVVSVVEPTVTTMEIVVNKGFSLSGPRPGLR